MPGKELTEEQVMEKFVSCVSRVRSKDDAKALFRHLSQLENPWSKGVTQSLRLVLFRMVQSQANNRTLATAIPAIN